MDNEIHSDREERARYNALSHAVGRPAATEMSADDILADAEKFYSFLVKNAKSQ